jgi:hypothetical protein
MHPTDDLTTRGGLMVARAAATWADIQHMREQLARPDAMIPFEPESLPEVLANIRALAASDAALARAIDAVPAEPINRPRIARYHAETD